MNCDHCRNELEDFLYGELGESRAAELRAHLGNCADCAALRDEIDHENEIFGRFYEQTAIEPAAEMWEAIRARIEGGSRDRTLISEGSPAPAFAPRELGWLERLRARASRLPLTPLTLRQAAFAALLVVLSVAATTIYLKLGESGTNKIANNGGNGATTPTPRQIASPSPSPMENVADAGADRKSGAPAPKGVRPQANRVAPPRQLTDQELVNQQIARAEREYQKAIRLLDQAIAKQRDRLDPTLIKQYESSLALIDNSINASRRALRERPDDLSAGQFLLAAYAKKIDLMQEIAMK
jgi:anti-sigma factor RsiW